jgi:hypothetical protein
MFHALMAAVYRTHPHKTFSRMWGNLQTARKYSAVRRHIPATHLRACEVTARRHLRLAAVHDTSPSYRGT